MTLTLERLKERRQLLLDHYDRASVSDFYLVESDFSYEELLVITGSGLGLTNPYDRYVERVEEYCKKLFLTIDIQ